MESQSSIILLLLNNIEVILDKLLDLAGEKQRLVISGDCVGLDAIVKEEEEVLESLSAIQTQFEDNGSRLTGLAESEDFCNLKPGLVHKTFLLRRLNDQNQKLLSKSLELVRYELGLFLPREDYFQASKTAPIAFDQKA